MKKSSLLVFSMVLVAIAAGCTKENASEPSGFAGIDIEVGENAKLFVLNQGAWPAGSTLDLLDLKADKYYADIFGTANPEVVQGLGNTGNDMAVINGQLWVVLNASNQIAVLNLQDAKLVRYIEVDSPRYIIKKGDYAYVSSYGAAVNYSHYDVKGKLYRINTTTFVTDAIETGYQSEGLTVSGDNLYVANSGGYQATPDNTITVVDLKSFKVTGTLEMPVKNLKLLFSTAEGLWLTTYACYTPDWTAITAPMSLGKVSLDGVYTAIEGVHPDAATLCNGYIYAIGNAEEMTGGYDMRFYKVATVTGTVQQQPFASSDFARIGYAYGIAVNPANGDIYVSDANFKGDSQIHCFDAEFRWKWSKTTGVGTGPLLVW